MLKKLCESYGVLGHEKRPVYSEMIPASDVYNVVTVDIPDEYPTSENALGETLIDIAGNTYLLTEVLTNHGDKPCISWFDGKQKHWITLEIVK